MLFAEEVVEQPVVLVLVEDMKEEVDVVKVEEVIKVAMMVINKVIEVVVGVISIEEEEDSQDVVAGKEEVMDRDVLKVNFIALVLVSSEIIYSFFINIYINN